AAHFENGDFADARGDLSELLAQPAPPLEDLLRAAAVEYMDRAKGGRPEPFFERIRARDPENAALHYMLAREALEAGDFEGALEHYRTILRTRPDDLAAR